MRRHRIVTWVGIGLYLLSMVLPAIVVRGEDLFGHHTRSQVMYGFQCLVLGFVVLPGWLANPFVLIGAPLLAVGIRRPAIVLFALALISAVIAPFLLIHVEMSRLEHLHVGYVVWLASIVTLLVAAITAPASAPASLPSRILPRSRS